MIAGFPTFQVAGGYGMSRKTKKTKKSKKSKKTKKNNSHKSRHHG